MILKKLLPLLLLGLMVSKGAQTYYIDFAAGNDASAGTSTGTAWRTIPGTRSGNGQSLYVTTSYAGGAVSITTKVQDNTTFKFKGGTTSTKLVTLYEGSGEFYQPGLTNIVFEVDPGWGSGPVIFDGTGSGITTADSIAFFTISTDGVTLNGVYNVNSPISNVYYKEHAGSGNPILNPKYLNCVNTNSGTIFATDAGGADSAGLRPRHVVGLVVSNCVFQGNSRTNNAIYGGDSGKVATGIIVNTTMSGYKGDEDNNDAGVNVKCVNGQLMLSNIVTFSSNKGWDLGEHNGGSSNINYLVINSLSYSNTLFSAFNSAAGAYAGTVTFGMANNVIHHHDFRGINAYAGPFNFYCVHNVFWMNGITNNTDSGQIRVTPNSTTDSGSIRAYVYNNIIKDSRGPTVMSTAYGALNTTDFTLTLDYNAYNQTWPANFFKWSYFAAPAADFNFGINGPGYASGNWYSQYGTTTTPPTQGLGHFHSDSHSIGTGCADTTLATFNTTTWAPDAQYAGRNLALEPWYQTWMGTDRNGLTRTNWTIGAIEFTSSPPGGPTISTISNKTIPQGTSIAIPFTADDSGNPVTITRSTSNTTLLPLVNCVVTGTQPNYTLTLTPVSTQTGSSTVRVTATDADMNAAYTEFTLTVTAPATSGGVRHRGGVKRK